MNRRRDQTGTISRADVSVPLGQRARKSKYGTAERDVVKGFFDRIKEGRLGLEGKKRRTPTREEGSHPRITFWQIHEKGKKK